MIFETFIKGVLIGLSISVPLGPIGMLCIQRTLNKGQKYGIVSGIGATFSDLIYSIITMFFLNIVIDFINSQQVTLQIIGSVIILFFGLWIYLSHPPVQPLPHEKPKEHSIFSDFITSMALTLSNPLIVFVLIALFARFDFVNTDMHVIDYVFGLFSILVGASLWWIILTTFVSHFRSKLNYRGLRMINKIIGSAIILIGIIGVIFTLIEQA